MHTTRTSCLLLGLPILLALGACSSSDDDDGSASQPASWQDCTFVAVGHDGTAACMSDGTSWLSTNAIDTGEALSGIASDGGGNLVAVGQGGSILRSTDRGATWTLAHSLPDEVLGAVASDGDRFVVGASPALVSTDGGATWTEGGALDPEADVEVAVASVASTGSGQFVAVGTAFRATAGVAARRRIYASLDGGATWAVVDDGEVQSGASALSDGYQDVASSGSRAVVVGANGLVKVAAGPAFDTWEDATGIGADASLYAVAYDASSQRFVAGELEGAIYVSDDGGSWSPGCSEPESNSVTGIAVRGGELLAVGPGTAVMSSDGGETCRAAMPALVLHAVAAVEASSGH
ncbi:MAG: WD40/YVTN/BNR-like repeat-containing protein [Myxococcota bacterium]